MTYMYSIVPQKVWVTVPSWMDSLHRPKSVNFTWPRWNQSKHMRETTLQTNKRLSITLLRERSHSGIKASHVERTCLYEHNLPFVRDTSGFCTIVIEHDVLRLQVSIDDAFLVQVTQSHRDLSQVETVNRKKQITSTSEICFSYYLSLMD